MGYYLSKLLTLPVCHSCTKIVNLAHFDHYSGTVYQTVSNLIANHGGVVLYQNLNFEIARTDNIRRGKEHPFILIPGR